MTSSAISLWDSIFTPGPTPILVRAMNLSFLALIALLIPLIYATENIHVFLLTVLAVGLWIAMHWYDFPRRKLIKGLLLNLKRPSNPNLQLNMIRKIDNLFMKEL